MTSHQPVGPPVTASATARAADDGDDRLVVDGLDVHVGGVGLLHDVGFRLRGGERVGLIGESGSGKSLTALAVMGLLPEGLHARGHVGLAGAGNGRGANLLEAGEARLADLRGRRLSMVFQEPMTALNPLMRAGDQVAEVLSIHADHGTDGASRGERRERVRELLAAVALSEPDMVARRYPHQLSGGQRQRVMLAMALANDPDVLVCDEPTTALDVTVQAQMLDLVVRGAEERDAALLFITHDLAVVATVCERVLVMYGGRIVEAGPVRQVFTTPRHPYTRGLVASSDLDAVDAAGRLPTIPGVVPAAGRFPSGCVFRTRCDRATEECAQPPPWTGGPDDGHACIRPHTTPVPGLPPGPVANPVTTPDPEPATPDPATPDPATPSIPPTPTSSVRITAVSGLGALTRSGLAGDGGVRGDGRDDDGDGQGGGRDEGEVVVEVDGLSRAFRRPRTSLFRAPGAVEALRDVDLDVRAGQRFGIVGESGSGKSTLLALMAALDQPTAGTVSFRGRPVSGVRARHLDFLRDDLQIVFQDPMGSLDPRMRVADIITEPLVAQGHPDRAGRLAELLDAVGLPADAGRRWPHQFSGGQRQRIAIARALSTRPKVLLADEPVSALDVSVRAQILNLLTDLVGDYDLTLVFVSHDLTVVRHLCDWIAVMRAGEVVEQGPTEQVADHPRHPYTQALLGAVPNLHAALAGQDATRLAAHATAPPKPDGPA